MLKVFSFIVGIFWAISIEAQVLTTAETIGKDKQAVMISENRLFDSGVTLNVAYVMYIRSLSSSLDLYASIGETHILGQDQVWAGIGGNVRLLAVKGTSISLFSLTTIPLHRHQEASTVLVNTAIVVSRVLTSKLSVYTGLNTLVPVGARDRGLFTPQSARSNVPLGTGVNFGSWTMFAEADLGKLKALGVALSKTF